MYLIYKIYMYLIYKIFLVYIYIYRERELETEAVKKQGSSFFRW